jgi:hypothetical protein
LSTCVLSHMKLNFKRAWIYRVLIKYVFRSIACIVW